MAGEPSGADLNTENWEEWTYVMAVWALTNQSDLSLVPAPDKPFLAWQEGAAGNTDRAKISQQFYYWAYGKQYFGVAPDAATIQAWKDQVDQVRTVVKDLVTDGSRGTFQLQKLAYFYGKLLQLQTVTGQLSGEMDVWVQQTSGSDGPLAGKAVDVLRARLDGYAQTLGAWSAQMAEYHTVVPWRVAMDAYEQARILVNQLAILGDDGGANTMSAMLAGLPEYLINSYDYQIYVHMFNNGLIAGPNNYTLYQFYDTAYLSASGGPNQTIDVGGTKYPFTVTSTGLEGVDAYIRAVLAKTPVGNEILDITTPAAWDRINRMIREYIGKIVANIDWVAQAAVPPAFDAYKLLTRSLPTLEDPTTVPSNPNGDLNLNGPNDLNLNTPNLNLDFNLPNFNLNLDQLGLDGPGSGGPNDLTARLKPAEIFVPPGGPDLSALGNSPNGLGDSFFRSNVPTGASGPGLGADLGGGRLGPSGEVLGPGGQPILGPSGEILGPGGKPILGPNGEILGPGGKPILGPNGEILGPDGKPILGPNGQPILGPNGQPIVIPGLGPLPGGGGGTIPDFTPGSFVPPGSGVGDGRPITLPVRSDGTFAPPGGGSGPLTPEALADQLTSQGLTGGNPTGFPMYPPMGGMGGGGGRDREERERQTWLTEDEAVWGTTAGTVRSVIGRPEDAAEADEELILLGPVRGSRPDSRSGAKPATRQKEARAQANHDHAGVEPDTSER